MKHQAVRNKLLMETLMIAGGLLVAFGGLYFLSSVHDDYEQERRSLQTQVASLSNEMQSLSDKYANIQNNHALFEEASRKNERKALSISRDFIRTRFDQYKQHYYLGNLKLNMTPVRDVGLPAYTRKTAGIEFSEVSVTMDTLTDEDVYRLTQAIKSDFPGAVKMTDMQIRRESTLSKEALAKIATEGGAKMVSASLKFLWLGIKPVEPEGKAQAGEGDGGAH